MNVVSIRIEGGLLSPDFLERIHEMPGQRPADFGLDSNRPLVDETTAIYADARVYWDAFQRRRTHSSTESVTSITREQWVIPLLELLGYKLAFQRKAAEADGKSYAISHRASADDTGPPVHIVGADQELGSRPPSGRGTMSPHALVQDYLNRTDNLWGVVTNGHVLRLLRDSSYFTRPSYIEFDLRQMMQGEQLDEFILLYRLAHRSRLPQTTADAPHCLLERYHQHALDQGGRIRDGLRNAVEQAIRIFGNGFLRHSRNEALRQAIRDQQLTPRRFYQQLLYLIYRLLFLMVAEERGLLVSRQNQTAGDFYRAHLSLARLRVLADEPLSAPERFDDLFLALQTLFHVLHDEKLAGQLALPPLNGKLFDSLLHIDPARLNNRDLLNAIRSLSWFVPAEERVPRRINYAALDVEELGSVYESLLELQPVFTETEGRPAFGFAHGTERKSTGSYYTAPELVGELIQSALVPVIEERLRRARELARSEVANKGRQLYANQLVSRSQGVATSHATGGGVLSGHATVPKGGTVRHDLTDSQGQRINPGQHRGGLGAGGHAGVHSVPPGRTGGSLKELETLLLLSQRVGLLTQDQLSPTLSRLTDVGKMTHSLIGSLQRKLK